MPGHKPMMSPGTYLRKRRQAAGYSLRALAMDLSTLPGAIKQATPGEITRLSLRVDAAEDDLQPLPVEQAALLRNVFVFDLGIYEQLLTLHLAGPDSGLPEPQVCRECACSWHDACRTARGACAWAEPDLCTACLPRVAAAAAAERSTNVLDFPQVQA